MKRTFVDLHLRVNPKDTQVTQRVIQKAAKLGYKAISIPFSGQLEEDRTRVLKAACVEVGLDFVVRADFKPRNQEDLMRFLRKVRRKVEVICIFCENKEIARHAAKDHRVDLINFQSIDYRKRFFDSAEAELASCSQTALEVDINPLLMLGGPPRVRLLSCLRREVVLAREFHVPVVLSSGVCDAALMRMPRDMASLAYLFGLNETEALNAVSSNPLSIVQRNREKLGATYVAPGIRLVKEGKQN
jgi:ribonuclease P/MRP protein subunit RPP1